MKTKIMCKLERIAKIGTVEQRQEATSLLDAMNLGVDNMKDAEKFVKKFEKTMEKSENMPTDFSKLRKMLDECIKSFNEKDDYVYELENKKTGRTLWGHDKKMKGHRWTGKKQFNNPEQANPQTVFVKEDVENPMVVADVQADIVNDAVDVVKLDIPLMLRLLEWSREEANKDADLHVLTENMVNMMKTTEFLTMSEYDALIPYQPAEDIVVDDVVVDDLTDDIFDEIEFIEESKINENRYATEQDMYDGTISDEEYLDTFEYIYSSLINGNISQYKQQLARLLKEGDLKAYKNWAEEHGLEPRIIDFLESKRVRRGKSFDKMHEEFKDEMSMLTQIQDTDFPQALADTVETDENGELVTLTKILNQIEWVKDEISSEIEDVKKEITDVKIDIKATEKASQIEKPVEEVEVVEPVEEVPTEEVKDEPIEEPIEKEDDKKEPTEDKEDEEKLEESFNGRDLKTVWAEDMQRQPIMEFPNGHVVHLEPDYDRNVIVYGGMTNGGIIPEGEVEFDNTKSLDWHIQGIYDELINDNLEENYSNYIRKGCLEDLNQTKREIDNQVRQGKSAKEIKDTIVMKSDNDKEQDEAEDYAIDKLKESLLNTQASAKLKNL